MEHQERSSFTHDSNDHITINEDGAYIPRTLFGREELIVDELREAGVFPVTNGETPKKIPVRVEMPDRSREVRWITGHKQEYAGHWVALDGDRLLSHGFDARQVFAEADRSDVEEPFFAHLEPTDALPFGGW